MSFENIKMGRIPKQEKETTSYMDSNNNDDGEDSQNFKTELNKPLKHPAWQRNKNNNALVLMHPIANSSPDLGLKNIYNFDINEYKYLTQTNFQDPNDPYNSNNHVFFSLLRNRSRDLYSGFMEQFKPQTERNAYYLQNNLYPECSLSKVIDVFKGLAIDITIQIKELINYSKKLPGFSSLSQQDISLLIKYNFFPLYFMTTCNTAYIGKKLYYTLPNNCFYTRNLMSEALGDDITQILFETASKVQELRLTHTEMSLLIPYILTVVESGAVGNYSVIRQINQQYKKALLREFNANKRDVNMIKRLSTVSSIFLKIIINYPERKVLVLIFCVLDFTI